jgi:putative chitinase
VITEDKLGKIMPTLPANRRALYFPRLKAAMEGAQITTPAREAAFLAQLSHESGELRWMQEIADGSAYDGRADLGNTRPEAIAIAKAHGTTPGRFWKGHGPIQTTGYDNHKAVGEALGIDAVNHPELLALPEHGFRAAAYYWITHNLNALADAGEFRLITRAVNGGIKGLEGRVKYWLLALRVLGVDL